MNERSNEQQQQQRYANSIGQPTGKCWWMLSSAKMQKKRYVEKCCLSRSTLRISDVCFARHHSGKLISYYLTTQPVGIYGFGEPEKIGVFQDFSKINWLFIFKDNNLIIYDILLLRFLYVDVLHCKLYRKEFFLQKNDPFRISSGTLEQEHYDFPEISVPEFLISHIIGDNSSIMY